MGIILSIGEVLRERNRNEIEKLKVDLLEKEKEIIKLNNQVCKLENKVIVEIDLRVCFKIEKIIKRFENLDNLSEELVEITENINSKCIGFERKIIKNDKLYKEMFEKVEREIYWVKNTSIENNTRCLNLRTDLDKTNKAIIELAKTVNDTLNNYGEEGSDEENLMSEEEIN